MNFQSIVTPLLAFIKVINDVVCPAKCAKYVYILRWDSVNCTMYSMQSILYTAQCPCTNLYYADGLCSANKIKSQAIF